VDAPFNPHVVYDKLFVNADNYPTYDRNISQVFTREMGIACAKRLISRDPQDPSVGPSDRWEFNPITFEVLVSQFIITFNM
jgi:hypothetical protein